ncbi:MAG: LPS assembly lipoprotein LptE [Rhodospirillales bacterium]|nr:LPS assembly lipoprotein LptE [Rhodospirillales bacterium]
MWWFRNIPAALLIGAALFFLAGCGYRPLYGKPANHAGVPDILSTVYVSNIPDRPGQLLRNRLMTMLTPRGIVDKPNYRLDVIISESVGKYAKRTDETSTRAVLSLTASFRLYRNGKEAVVFSGASTGNVGYDIVDAEYGAIAAEKDALKSAIELVAADIRTRLAAYLVNPEKPEIKAKP